MTKTGAFLAATAFGFLSAALGAQVAQAGEKDGSEVMCEGINACKGTGACGGAGHGCSGQNGCKGQGVTKTTEKECKAKGGKVAVAKKEEGKKEEKKN